MGARSIRKYFNLFISGIGYAGEVEEVNPPKLTLKTEEFRAGGMAVPIELTMGMEKLEADYTLVTYDPTTIAGFGVVEGNTLPFVLREAIEAMDGTITASIHTMRGKIKALDSGTSKAGEVPKLKATLALNYYKLQVGDTVIHEIDVENMIQVINGTDALAATRTAIGL